MKIEWKNDERIIICNTEEYHIIQAALRMCADLEKEKKVVSNILEEFHKALRPED